MQTIPYISLAGANAWWCTDYSISWAKYSKSSGTPSVALVSTAGMMLFCSNVCVSAVCVAVTLIHNLFNMFVSEQGPGGQQIVIQQPQQAQILQTSDGQTLIYQPVQLDQQNLNQQAQPTCKLTEFKKCYEIA